MNSKAIRESNIELLRVIAMLGVILLHYNNPSIGGALKSVSEGSINYWYLNTIESLCACSVDLFMIISGYFLAKSKKRDLWKIVQLLMQVIIFSIIKYLLICIIKSEFSLYKLFIACFPSNYFVILYVTVFVISPFINVMLEHLTASGRKIFLMVSLLLFSIYPTAVDILVEVSKHSFNGLSSIGMYGSQYGYSVVNFILCYCIGAIISFDEQEYEKYDTKTLGLTVIVSVILMTGWSFVNDIIGFYTEKTAWEYCNPLVILLGVCIFLIFKKIKIGKIKTINTLAKGSFTVYLIHINLITHIGVNRFVNGNLLMLILHMFGSAALIYLICWLVYYVYSIVESILFNHLKRRVQMVNFDIERFNHE